MIGPLRRSAVAASLCLALLVGCSTSEAPAPHAHPALPKPPPVIPIDDDEAQGDPLFLDAPTPREVRHGEGGATVHRDHAIIVAGEMHLDVRPNSLKEPMIAQVRTKSLEEFEVELPTGLLVGAAHGSPRDAGFLPVARWHIPLDYELPPGTTLEVLSWHPQLLTWMNLGDTQVNAAGTHAVFFTMVMGDVVLRRKPVRDPTNDELCPGSNFRLKEEWPGAEDVTVGLTPETERVSREDAFRYMADFRLTDAYPRIAFKNEELLGAWHRNAVAGQSYTDEDFLMDPNGAAALAILEYYVSHEWVDPYTGEPAVRVRLTEAYDSMIEHSRPSTHYQGRGIDLTLDPVPPPGSRSRRAYYGRLSRLAVCAGFDYVLFEDNFHVHASVLPTKVATLVLGDDERFGVLVGDLWAPERWTLLRHRWTAEELDARSLAWTGWNTIEVRGEGEDALFLHAEDEAPRTGPRTDDPGRRHVQLRTQELRVMSEQLYFVNTDGRPPIGSGRVDDEAVRVAGPTQFPLGDWRVQDAVFRPHTKTREAWSVFQEPRRVPLPTQE